MVVKVLSWRTHQAISGAVTFSRTRDQDYPRRPKKARGNVPDLRRLARYNNRGKHGALNWILGQIECQQKSGWVPQGVWSCHWQDAKLTFLGFMSVKTHHASNDDLELQIKQETHLKLMDYLTCVGRAMKQVRKRGPAPESCLLAFTPTMAHSRLSQ